MKKDGRGASYSWVAKIALCDGLEEGRFADVGETDLGKDDMLGYRGTCVEGGDRSR